MKELRGAHIEVLLSDEASFNIDYSNIYPLYFQIFNSAIYTIIKEKPKNDWKELVSILENR